MKEDKMPLNGEPVNDENTADIIENENNAINAQSVEQTTNEDVVADNDTGVVLSEDEPNGDEQASEEDVKEDTQNNEGEPQEETDEADKKTDKKKKTKSMLKIDKRRLRYGSMATAMTAAVVAVVILINIVAGILNDRFPVKLDLTADKLFTLSEDSLKIAKNLKRDTLITVFGDESNFTSPSTDIPDLNTVFKQFYEMTREYSTLSDGKIKVNYVDLITNPALAQKYSKYEVNEGSILFECGNRWQKASVSDMFSYNQEAYQYYQQMTDVNSHVEKVLASNILMVTSDFTPLVTVLSGHDEDGAVISGIESVIKNNNYETETLDITGSAEFNEESQIALIAAPKTDYAEAEIEKLRNWLNNDGNYNRHLAVVVNLESDCPNLYEFLNVEYGLEVTDNLIFETDPNKTYNYTAFWPIGDIKTGDFTENIAGRRALMPVTRQIITHKEDSKDYSLYNVDVVTFDDTSRLVKLADALTEPEEGEQIKQVEADEYPVTGVAYATKWGYNEDNEQYKTNVAVYGSQQALSAEVLSLTFVENERVLLSLFNGFTGNENTVTISSKPLDKTRLEFTTGQANIFFIIFVVTIPIALLVTCLIIFIRRRRL